MLLTWRDKIIQLKFNVHDFKYKLYVFETRLRKPTEYEQLMHAKEISDWKTKYNDFEVQFEIKNLLKYNYFKCRK